MVADLKVATSALDRVGGAIETEKTPLGGLNILSTVSHTAY